LDSENQRDLGTVAIFLDKCPFFGNAIDKFPIVKTEEWLAHDPYPRMG